VVDVRMGEQNSVDVCGIEREVELVTTGRIATALHEPAIDE
jgi:hydrogenase maturation factor